MSRDVHEIKAEYERVKLKCLDLKREYWLHMANMTQDQNHTDKYLESCKELDTFKKEISWTIEKF